MADKVEQKDYTVKVSHNPHSGFFFIDLWEGEKYVCSVKVTEGVAKGISKYTGIKIMIQ